MKRWMIIPGWDDAYAISEDGQVKSLTRKRNMRWGVTRNITEKICRQTKRSDGYKVVSLRRLPLIKKTPLVHRLVAEAFIPRVAGKNVVNHINGIKDDNRVENLEWVNHSENLIHCWRVLKANKPNVTGINNPRCVLTERDVSEIRSKLESNSDRELGAIYGVSKSTISSIRYGKNWKFSLTALPQAVSATQQLRQA